MSNNVDINIKTAVENQKDVTELQKELIKLGQSSEAVDQQVDELTSTLTNLAAAAKLKESLENSSKELETITDNLEKAKEAYQRASEEILLFSQSADPKALKEMNKVLSDQEKELKKLEQAQARAQKKYADTNKAIDSSSDSVKELINDNTRYAESVKKAEQAQEKLTEELNKLKEIGDAYDKLGVQDLEQEIEDLEKAYKVLKESGTLSADELRQAHEKLTEEVQKYKNELSGADQAYANIKKGAVHFLPVAAALTAASKSAIDYEDKMADVRKVVEATDEEFADLSKTLLDMSKTTPVSAAGLAEIAAAGAQLGVELGNLKEFVTITSDMATAFDMTAEDAGNAVANLSNIFGIAINDTGRLGDAINYLSNSSAASADQIVDVLVRIGGTGKAIGLTESEVAALGSSLIAFGKSPEIAGTALNAFLNRLQVLGTLGPNAQDALQKIGISAVEMSQLIEKDASEAIVYFLEQVNNLNSADKAGALTAIFGAGPQSDVLLMASNVDQLREQFEKVADEADYFGSMQDEATERAKTTAGQIEILKNNINALAIDLGSKLLPTINETVKSFSSIAQGIGAFAEANPAITGLILKLVVVASTAKMLGGALSLVGIKGGEAFAKLNVGVQSTSASLSAFATNAISRIPIVGTRIATLTASVASLNNNLKASSSLALGAATSIAKIGAQLAAINLLVDAFAALNEQMRASEALEAAKKRADKEIEEIRRKRLDQLWEEQKAIIQGTQAQKEKLKANEEEAAQIAILNESLEKLGLSYNQIEKGLTKTGEAAINAFNDVGHHAKSTSKIINQAFGAALQEVSTPQEFMALTQSFYALGEQGKITAEDMANYKVQIDELYKSVRLGVITDAEFAEKKKEISGVIAEQVNGFAALNNEITKQISLINTQIQQDKQIVESMIKKLEAEKSLAEARGDSLTAEQLSQQIETARIKNMERESVLIREIVAEYQKELNVLLARKANGEALNEQERERIKVLQTEITARENEAEAIKIAAQAKEVDSTSADKNARSLNNLASASKSVANASTQVSNSSKSVNEELKSTNERIVITSSLLGGMADESKIATLAMDDLKKAVFELNKARAYDAVSMSLTNSMTDVRIQQLSSLKKNIADEINYLDELEDKLNSVNNASLEQINAWGRMVSSMKYVNEDSVKSVQRSIESMKNSVLDAYATIDQENTNLLNKLTGMRNQSEEHQLRMKQFNERAEAERKLREAQEIGDSEKQQRLQIQLQLIQQIHAQEQRDLRNSKLMASQDKNQKLDINLNGTQLNNLDPNNTQDMNKIAEAVVVAIKKDQQKSTKFRIKG